MWRWQGGATKEKKSELHMFLSKGCVGFQPPPFMLAGVYQIQHGFPNHMVGHCHVQQIWIPPCLMVAALLVCP
jgi:hypothetical protein